MIREWAAVVWDLVKRTFVQWQSHRSAEMASSLAFYGALALAGLALVATYVAGAMFGGSARSNATSQAGRFAGPHNAQAVDAILRELQRPHMSWIALVVGCIIFVLAVAGTAFQLQRALDAVWDVKPEEKGNNPAGEAERHIPQFAAIFGLALLLIVLLFAGASVHALTYHTHRMPQINGVLYGALDVGVSIVLLTLVFLFIFAYLPPADIPWKKAWIGAFVSAILYERGQFALAVYFGLMDARSPYADVGAVVAVLLWLYYSAEVVLVGAEFTKALKLRADEGGKRKKKRAA